jgi:hypothetical protein
MGLLGTGLRSTTELAVPAAAASLSFYDMDKGEYDFRYITPKDMTGEEGTLGPAMTSMDVKEFGELAGRHGLTGGKYLYDPKGFKLEREALEKLVKSGKATPLQQIKYLAGDAGMFGPKAWNKRVSDTLADLPRFLAGTSSKATPKTSRFLPKVLAPAIRSLGRQGAKAGARVATQGLGGASGPFVQPLMGFMELLDAGGVRPSWAGSYTGSFWENEDWKDSLGWGDKKHWLRDTTYNPDDPTMLGMPLKAGGHYMSDIMDMEVDPIKRPGVTVGMDAAMQQKEKAQNWGAEKEKKVADQSWGYTLMNPIETGWDKLSGAIARSDTGSNIFGNLGPALMGTFGRPGVAEAMDYTGAAMNANTTPLRMYTHYATMPGEILSESMTARGNKVSEDAPFKTEEDIQRMYHDKQFKADPYSKQSVIENMGKGYGYGQMPGEGRRPENDPLNLRDYYFLYENKQISKDELKQKAAEHRAAQRKLAGN